MEAIPISIVIATAIFVVIFWFNGLRVIDTPNVGLVRRFGKIILRRLKPGYHFLWRLGPIVIDELIIGPGGLIVFDIPIEEIVVGNVAATIDTQINLKLKTAPDGLPAYGAVFNLITWLKLRPGESLVGGVTRDGTAVPGKLERVLTAYVQDAAESVIKGFKPEEITSTPQIFNELRRQIFAKLLPIIDSWGTIEDILIQDLRVKDEITREKTRRDAQADASRVLTATDAQARRYERLAQVDPRFAQIAAMGDALQSAKNVTLVGGVESALEGLFALREAKKGRLSNE